MTKLIPEYIRDSILQLLPTIVGLLIVTSATLISIGVEKVRFLHFAVLLGFILTLIIFTILLSRLERRPPTAENLRERLAKAFADGLENSSLNPEGGRQERHVR
jgi:hypothetical protein